MADHEFGGDWTELKLAVVKAYLGFFTMALKNQTFKTVYIDAFAGSGERVQTNKDAPIFGEGETKERFAGSAMIALETNPPFHSYHFIEKKPSFYKQLKQEVSDYAVPRGLDARCYSGTAEEHLKTIITQHVIETNNRAVLFLDPYGLDVSWEMLKFIQATEKIDVFYLFSLSGIYRNMTVKFANLDADKINSLDRTLGTTEWQTEFYRTPDTHKQGQIDMFSTPETRCDRQETPVEIESYLRQRLSKLFPYVSEPIALLPRGNGAQLFSLFFCMSNPNKRALELGNKVYSHIFKKITG